MSVGEQQTWSPGGSWGQPLCFPTLAAGYKTCPSVEGFKQKCFSFAALQIRIFLLNAFVQVGRDESLYLLLGLALLSVSPKLCLEFLAVSWDPAAWFMLKAGEKRAQHMPMAAAWWKPSC